MHVAFLIPDCHIPYHDRKAYALALKVAKAIHDGEFQNLELKEIVILGDYADFYAVNSHGKHPQMNQLLSEEIDFVNQELNLIDEMFCGVDKTFIFGNHEQRLERFVENYCPTLFGLTSCINLFEFHRRRNWTLCDYGPKQLHRILGSQLYARHEPFSMSSAMASVKKSMINLVYGHVHRAEEATITGALNSYTNFSVGWLGDVRKSQVFGYTKTPPNWQLGFGVVYVNPKTRQFSFDKIMIQSDYTCFFAGRIFEG